MESLDLSKDTKYIHSFLTKHTNHKPENIESIRRGRVSTYIVIVKTDEVSYRVDFWIYDKTLSYGIVGFGITSTVTLKSLE